MLINKLIEFFVDGVWGICVLRVVVVELYIWVRGFYMLFRGIRKACHLI